MREGRQDASGCYSLEAHGDQINAIVGTSGQHQLQSHRRPYHKSSMRRVHPGVLKVESACGDARLLSYIYVLAG